MSVQQPDKTYKGKPADSGMSLLFSIALLPMILILLFSLFKGRFDLVALFTILLLPFLLIVRSAFLIYTTTVDALIIAGQFSRQTITIPYSDIAEAEFYTYKLGTLFGVTLTNGKYNSYSLGGLDRNLVVALQQDLEQRGIILSRKLQPY